MKDKATAVRRCFQEVISLVEYIFSMQPGPKCTFRFSEQLFITKTGIEVIYCSMRIDSRIICNTDYDGVFGKRKIIAVFGKVEKYLNIFLLISRKNSRIFV